MRWAGRRAHRRHLVRTSCAAPGTCTRTPAPVSGHRLPARDERSRRRHRRVRRCRRRPGSGRLPAGLPATAESLTGGLLTAVLTEVPAIQRRGAWRTGSSTPLLRRALAEFTGGRRPAGPGRSRGGSPARPGAHGSGGRCRARPHPQTGWPGPSAVLVGTWFCAVVGPAPGRRSCAAANSWGGVVNSSGRRPAARRSRYWRNIAATVPAARRRPTTWNIRATHACAQCQVSFNGLTATR